MSRLKITCCSAIALTVAVCLFIAAGCSAPKPAPPAVTTGAGTSLAPGPNDARIAYWTARFLEDRQYSMKMLDMGMSEKFFDGYLELLDPRRENFLQSDIDEFMHYRTNLDALTIGGRGRANLAPAYEIFGRYMERLTQHTDFVNKLLAHDRFRFDTDERIVLDRRHAPYPKDKTEAEELWSQQLRYDYLTAKLGLEFSPTNGGTMLPLPKSANTDITADLTRRYNWNLHYFTNWDGDNVLQVYLTALTHAYDPHTDYLNHQHAQNFSIEMSLSLFGIGAQLSEDVGYCTIDSLIPGGPADKSGQIKNKERVIAVAQSNLPPVNVVDMDLSKVVEQIRGPKGTQVRLTLEEKDNPASSHVVILTRDEIKIEDQEAKAKLIEMPDGRGETNRIGVIDVPSFYFPTDIGGNTGHLQQSYVSVDVAKLIRKLEQEKVGGIILDMRGNPGGSLEEAIRLTGLFIKEGPVVLARNPIGEVQLDSITNAAALYSGPLVVLLNRFSASAAEIAAAALQDYGRAVVVGDTSTHGKGTVQSLMPLNQVVWPATPAATNDPGTLKITIRKFYRVTGASTQLKGVESDIVLPDVLNESPDIGETALENPLPWDTIPNVDFNKVNFVQPYLDDLHRDSESRIATNRDFNFIRQDIDEFKKVQADKTATLNEQEALNERKKNAAEKMTRDKDLVKRGTSDETIYNLTVENADKPGLPPPFVETNSPANISEVRLNEEARLDECEHILEDYISLLSKNASLIANQNQ
jgi:carboxyl-terminal processing protease